MDLSHKKMASLSPWGFCEKETDWSMGVQVFPAVQVTKDMLDLAKTYRHVKGV